MIYTITFVSGDNGKIRFGFNQFKDLTEFLITAIETVDGFDEGTTRIFIGRDEETKNER